MRDRRYTSSRFTPFAAALIKFNLFKLIFGQFSMSHVWVSNYDEVDERSWIELIVVASLIADSSFTMCLEMESNAGVYSNSYRYNKRGNVSTYKMQTSDTKFHVFFVLIGCFAIFRWPEDYVAMCLCAMYSSTKHFRPKNVNCGTTFAHSQRTETEIVILCEKWTDFCEQQKLATSETKGIYDRLNALCGRVLNVECDRPTMTSVFVNENELHFIIFLGINSLRCVKCWRHWSARKILGARISRWKYGLSISSANARPLNWISAKNTMSTVWIRCCDAFMQIERTNNGLHAP